MSWSINFTGLRAQVKEQVVTTNLPPAIKQVIVEIIDDPTAGPSRTNGVSVKGNGHGNDPAGPGGQWRACATLDVQPVEILVPTPQPAPEQVGSVVQGSPPDGSPDNGAVAP